jgi:hypothetical protein
VSGKGSAGEEVPIVRERVAKDPAEPSAPSATVDPTEAVAAASPRSSSGIEEPEPRIGPFEVTKRLVDAPGASIVEARDPNGAQCLLQVVLCRNSKSGDKYVPVRDFLQMIETATQTIAADPDVRMISSGSSDRRDGTRVLYWALPWTPDGQRLGRATAQVKNVRQLARIAIALLMRIADRHERGRIEPLLSEQLVMVKSTGEAELIGLPIHVPSAWLADEMLPPRFAPEERVSNDPGQPGDFWRLGTALKELASGITPVPAELSRVLDSLTDPDPVKRESDPVKAIDALKMLERAPEPQAASLSKIPADHETLADVPLPLKRTILDEPVQGLERDQPPYTDSEAPTGDHTKAAQKRGLQDVDRVIAERVTLTLNTKDVAESIASMPLNAEQKSELFELVTRWQQLEESRKAGKAVAPRSDEPGVRDRPAAAPEHQMLALSNAVTKRTIPPEGETLLDARRPIKRDADAGAETQPDLERVPMEIPMETAVFVNDPVKAIVQTMRTQSASVKRGGTAWDRAMTLDKRLEPAGPHGTVAGLRAFGPKGTVVGARPLAASFRIVATHGQEADPPVPSPRLLSAGTAAGEGAMLPAVIDRSAKSQAGILDPATTPSPRQDNARVRPGPVSTPSAIREVREPWRRYAADALLVVILSITLGLVFHELMPTAQGPAREQKRTVTTANEVILDVQPKDAIIIGEEDGRVLGAGSLTLLIPPGSATAVLVTAKNYEPQRIVLPERGRISTNLLPLEYREPCMVNLRLPPNMQLEGVTGGLESYGAFRIPSALVVRAVPHGGAWLVRCPEFGGLDAQTLPPHAPFVRRELEIVEPRGAVAFVGHSNVGVVPVKTSTTGGFARVRIAVDGGSAIERWIPVFADTELRMPLPR